MSVIYRCTCTQRNYQRAIYLQLIDTDADVKTDAINRYKTPQFTEIHLRHTTIRGVTDSETASSVGSGLKTITNTSRNPGSCLTSTDGAGSDSSGTSARQQDAEKQTNPKRRR